MASFGGAIKLTGADEYKRSLKQATQSLRECGSELRAVTSSFDKNDKSAGTLEAQQKALNAVLDKQKATMSSLQSQYDSFSKKVEEQRAKHSALEAQYKNATAELQRIEAQSGKTSQAWQAQNKVVQEAQTAYHNSQVAMDANEKGLSDLAVKLNNAKTAVNTTSKEIDNLGNETEESGKQAEKAGDGFTVLKGILSNLGTQAINTSLAGVKKLGSTFVEVGKQALNSYADYEQLVGGVDTLFKDASKEVQKNASNAYKTAGLSANEYMDTVTSFSASLLQGLNGDTAKAAKIADQAIVDMSDNANKMGTDMTMIQNAYQGFAKQNYTMLDNLKLGYGGTASEMARLVNDSGVLGESVKVDAKTINSVSYDKIIEAIHKVQTNMGITGTTAKEASTTIQGSVNSMKSAWQNLLTGVADDNADFNGLIDNFVKSILDVSKNIVPRISVIISGIGTLVQEFTTKVLPTLLSEIGPQIIAMLPELMTTITTIITSLSTFLVENAPMVMDAITQVIMTLIQTVVTLLPQIVQLGIQLLVSLMNGISEALPQLIAMLPTVINTIVTTLIQNLPLIIQAGMDILVGLIQGLTNAIPQLIDMLPTIIETIVNVLIDNLPAIIEAAVQIMVALIEGLIKSLPKLIAMVPRIIMSIVETLASRSGDIILAGAKILTSLISGIGQMIGSLVGEIAKVGGEIINGFAKLPGRVVEIGKNLVQGLWNGINNAKDWVIDKIKGFGSSVLEGLKSFFGIHSPSRVFRDQIGKNLALGLGEGFSDEMDDVTKDMQGAVPTDFDASINATSGSVNSASSMTYQASMVSAFKEALSQMKIEMDDEQMGRFVDRTVTKLVYN